MTYKAFDFKLKQPEIYRDIFIAKLAEAGFEGFVETKQGFTAYTELDINPDQYLNNFDVEYTYTTSKIPEQNWNKTWEKQIKPLVIDDFIYIKTSFHPPKDYPLVLTIDPKMSFGTGHHETTFLMIQQLLELKWNNKIVLDMGAGTGVLAVLTNKFGAQQVYAVDNDKWAYENMLENFEKNQSQNIKAILGDANVLENLPRFDVILANINRNILLQDMTTYSQKLKKNGYLILSGFYLDDVPLLLHSAQKNGMIFEKQLEKNNWISLRLKKM